MRVSGPEALEIAGRIFRPAGPFPSHTAHHGTLIDPTTGEEIDDAVLTVFRAPASYTGEDVAEFSCHGGIAILKAALNATLACGARLAEPGEFTKRAFLNGKLDLAQAEAVNDLIRASADGARKMALRQLGGALSQKLAVVDARLLGVLAAVEAAVDFPEDVPEPDPQWIESEIEGAARSVECLLQSFNKGRIYREGLRVVIAGRVNVGKSSLLNALLRHARAIVTPIPGTTRDLIEEPLQIAGIPVVAIDTAGLRRTEDPVEKIGVELTQESIRAADIILLVLDVNEGVRREDVELLEQIGETPAILVLNKIDLLPEEARGLVTEEFCGRLGRSLPAVQTCASSGQGIDLLENEIAALAGASDSFAESALVSNARHEQALRLAFESLAQAADTIRARQPIDLLNVDLTSARYQLGLITGQSASDDLLDRIFSEFCVGK